MAANNTPCPSSPSESDSDREPNSSGGRVFWGNLKTPEKSRSAFIDPPQTVVRTWRASHTQTTHESAGPPTPVQDNISTPNDFSMLGEYVHLNDGMKEPESNQEQYDEALDHSRVPSDNDNGATDQIHPSSCLSELSQVSPQLAPMEVPSFATSESRIEREPVLQLSSPVDPLLPQDVLAQENSNMISLDPFLATQIAAHPSQSLAITDIRAPRDPEVPDLIHFDMLTPPQPLIPESQSHASPHPDPTPPSQLSSSSSNADVDELLTNSPVQSKSPPQTNFLAPDPSPSDAHASNLGEEVVTGVSLVNSEPLVSHVMEVSSDVGSTTQLGADAESNPSPTHTPLSTNDSVTPQQDTVTSNNSHLSAVDQLCIVQDGPAAPSFDVPDEAVTCTPKQVLSPFPPTSQGQTRKRSPLKGLRGKEEAHDGDKFSTELYNNTSHESPGPLIRSGDEGASDRAAIKERRAQVKREAERSRQQLLSLSPTSANVLDLLASPDRNGLTSPVLSMGLDEAVSDLAMNSQSFSGPAQVDPTTPQRIPARRVPISASPQRPMSPLRFMAPSPMKLDDPNRTPARRVLVPPNPQTPRPLDDPNRTPARRVTVQTSLARPIEPTDPQVPRIRIEESSPLKQTNAKPPAQSTSKLHDNDTTSRQTNGVPRPLPFPIRQNVTGGSTIVTTATARNFRPNTESGITRQQPSASVLRQVPSTSASKIARIAIKPYSRPGQAPSRLPVSSSLRGVVPSASSASTTNGTGPSKPRPSPAVVVPSRIPSPSKRSVPPVKSQTVESKTTPTTGPESVNDDDDKAHGLTTYKRKRQRMILEDDPDEPAAKRTTIMVRPVIKGMYSKASINNSDASESTMIQREASPVRRPQGPIQVRPVIPGTLRHFETSRSSSRDILDDTKMEANSDIQVTTTGGSSADVVVQPPLESRELTPLIETDTASTVSTLSREPTLEELAEPSVPRSDTPVPTDSGPELRRTTRIRKPFGPDALGLPSVPMPANKRDPMSLTRTTSMIQQEGTSSTSKGSSRSTSRTGTMQLNGLPSNPRQLQALTDANTLRNQTYFADLQRKVVRRYGPRPPSPSSKVRTMNEKSKEERAKEREARAERRRRRGLGSNASASSEWDYIDPPSSPTPDQPAPESAPPTKHVRGPGDEEDYETPERPPKPSVSDPSKVAKTVKWDRGLARTISEWAATQLTEETQERAESEPVGKGCLVRDRTTFRLDPFGNVPEANVPLEDLGRERIVITRFVYDDDIEATRTVKKKKT